MRSLSGRQPRQRRNREIARIKAADANAVSIRSRSMGRAAYEDDVGFDDDSLGVRVAEVRPRRGLGRVAQGHRVGGVRIPIRGPPRDPPRNFQRRRTPEAERTLRRQAWPRGFGEQDGHRSGLSGRGERVVRVGLGGAGRRGEGSVGVAAWISHRGSSRAVDCRCLVTSGCGCPRLSRRKVGARRFPRVPRRTGSERPDPASLNRRWSPLHGVRWWPNQASRPRVARIHMPRQRSTGCVVPM